MKEKASDIVYDLIRNKLVTGEWPCNSKIMSEAEIAKATGVSRSSVREGIDRLVKDGVLVRRQGDGTYVRNISPLILMTRLHSQAQAPASLLEILDFREMVEPEAVKRLIRNDDRSSLQTMISTLEKMQRCCELRSSDEYAQADSEFHFAILRGAHNSILERAIHIIQEQLIVYQYSANQMIGAKTGVEEHAAIVNAIFQKDEEMASLLLRRHIQRSNRDMVAYLKQTDEKG